jgi:tetratricopeptide (TPR) repeat protein
MAATTRRRTRAGSPYNGGVSTLSRLASSSSFAVALILLGAQPVVRAEEPARPTGPTVVGPWETRFYEAPAREVLDAARKVTVSEDPSAVILFEERVVTFSNDGTVKRRFRRAFRILKERAVSDWSQLTVGWEPWHEERPAIRARVITKDGRVHELNQKTIENVNEGTDDNAVYTDARVLRAPLPAVAAGAIIEEEVSEEERPILAGTGHSERWYFGDDVPVNRSRLVIDAPKGMALAFVQKPAKQTPPTRVEAGDRVRLTFEVSGLATLPDGEDDAPSDFVAVPYVGYATGESWTNISTRYAAVVDRQIAGAALASIVKEVKAGGPRDAASLIARLTARMHRDVRYTGVEFGDASIVPRTPGEVLERGYGDCKDKASFLVALLRAAGLRAHVALLRVQGAELDPELPGASRFNHAIVFLPGPHPLWIDPTDPHSPAGQLPLADQDRFALVADGKSSALVRTPRALASVNHVVETREMTLDEDGVVKVKERTEAVGAPGSSYRDGYDGAQRKKLSEMLLDYVKTQYRADDLVRFDYSDPKDVSAPFRLDLEAKGSKMGSLQDDTARVFLRTGPLFDRLPAMLRPGGNRSDDAQGTVKKRVADFVLDESYVYELRYRVVPPHGFAPADPPADEARTLGTSKLSFAYKVQTSGVIEATLRFETGKTRLSPAELEQERAALKKVYEEDWPVVSFRQIGAASLAAGRVREALTEYRRLDAAHPGQARHLTDIAIALLRAGLGEEARRQARRAVEVAPTEPLAHRILAWILEHDLIGRWMGLGSDLAGAEAAYRKALALDDKDQAARSSLANLLEYDAAGRHVYPRARLEEASRLYAALVAADYHTYDVSDLLVLFYLERFDAVVSAARHMTLDRSGQGIVLAALAAKNGVAATLKEAPTRVPDTEARREAIRLAAAELMRTRRYPEASALFAEAARDASNAAALRTLADQLARMKRRDPRKYDPARPESVVRELFGAILSQPMSGPTDLAATAAPYMAPEALAELRGDDVARDFRGAQRLMKNRIGDLPGEVLVDFIQGAEVEVDGDATAGYRVRFLGGGADGQGAFLGIRPGGPRVVGMTTMRSALGAEALRLAAKGDLASARRWLDWAVEGDRLGVADDPLSGSVTARLWTRGNVTADRARIERASYSLVASGGAPTAAIAPLRRCLEEQTGDTEHIGCALALVQAYRTLGRWEDVLALTSSLLAQYPTSLVATSERLWAFSKLGRWAEVKKLAEASLARNPEPIGYRLALAEALTNTGEQPAAEALLRRYLDKPGRSTSDYNQLAWMALCRGDAGTGTLELARRGVEMGQRRQPHVLHTLASVLAERDAPEEALEILRESLAARGDDEAKPDDWYVLGRIAETYGVTEAARAAYARVEKQTPDSPLSTYRLAQRRLGRLPTGGDVAGRK